MFPNNDTHSTQPAAPTAVFTACKSHTSLPAAHRQTECRLRKMQNYKISRLRQNIVRIFNNPAIPMHAICLLSLPI